MRCKYVTVILYFDEVFSLRWNWIQGGERFELIYIRTGRFIIWMRRQRCRRRGLNRIFRPCIYSYECYLRLYFNENRLEGI